MTNITIEQCWPTREDIMDTTRRNVLKEDVVLYSFILSVVSLLAPVHPILLTVIILIIADTVLGIWASLKNGVVFTSARAGRVISKLLIYETVLCVLYAVETNIIHVLPLVKLAASMIAVVETVSVLENAGLILGQPVFKFLIDKLGSINKVKQPKEKEHENNRRP